MNKWMNEKKRGRIKKSTDIFPSPSPPFFFNFPTFHIPSPKTNEKKLNNPPNLSKTQSVPQTQSTDFKIQNCQTQNSQSSKSPKPKTQEGNRYCCCCCCMFFLSSLSLSFFLHFSGRVRGNSFDFASILSPSPF